MTVSTPNNRVEYNGDGTTTVFSYPVYFLADDDVKVLLVNDTTSVETAQTITTDYTLVGAGLEGGGEVTMLTAPASGETLIIYRDPAVTQTADYEDNDPFPAATHEQALDKRTMVSIRTRELVGQAIKLSEQDSDVPRLPVPLVRAGKYLYFDAAGAPTVVSGVSTTDIPFITVSQIASTDLAAHSAIIVTGWGTPGDGGHALWLNAGASEPSQTVGKKQSQDGDWFTLVPGPEGASPEQLGAINAGAADDAARIQDWLDFVEEVCKRGIARGTYRADSTVTIGDPHGLSFDARGSSWTLQTDTLLLDVNGRADPTYTDNESRQMFDWIGGHFYCAVATPTEATAFRMFGMRKARLEPESFGLNLGTAAAEGFYRDIQAADKDSIYIGNYKTYDCEHASIEVPPWSMEGGNLLMHIYNIHGSIGNGASLVKTYFPLSDSHIHDVSCNMETGATHTGIEIGRYVLIGVPSVTSGPFTVGETVTAAPSGATGVLVEQYTHDWAFGGGGNTIWVVLKTRTGTFAASDTLTGGTSSASAVIPTDSAYLIQNSAWTNTTIGPGIHMEAGAGAGTGCTGIHLINGENAGTVPLAIHLVGITPGTNSTAGVSYGFRFEAMTRVSMEAIRFNHTGSNIPIQFDADCEEMTIKQPAFFSSGNIDLNSMSRQELYMSDWTDAPPSTYMTTGTLGAGSTGATAVVGAASQKGLIGGIGPKAFGLRVRLSGTTASSSTDCKIRCFKTGEVTATNKQSLQIAGLLDSETYWQSMTVEADSSAEFQFDGQNTSGGTVTYGIALTARYY